MRKMTGLYSSDFQPTLPPWMLEYPADLSQWTWSAPTPVEERQSRANTHEASPSALAGLLRFLAPAAAEPIQVEPIQQEEANLAEDDGISSKINRACEALCRSPSLPDLGDEYIQVMNSLEQDIYLGVVSAAAIPELFAGLEEAINRAFGDQLGLSSSDAEEVFASSNAEEVFVRPETWEDFVPSTEKVFASSDADEIIFSSGAEGIVERAKLKLVVAIIRGLSMSRVQGLEHLDPSACNDLLMALSELPKTQEAILLFQMFVRSVAESYVEQVSTGIHANILSWLPRDAKTPGAIVACLADGRIDMGQGTRLFDTAAALVTNLCDGYESKLRNGQVRKLSDGYDPELRDDPERKACLHIHSAWLSLLAHNPKISEDYFGNALARYTTTADNWSRHRNRQVSELMVLHWRSLKYIQPDFFPDIRSLGFLLYTLDSFRLRHSMVTFVQRMNAQEILLRSITKYCRIAPFLSVRRLRWVASATNDHRLVLRLLDLVKLHQHKMLNSTWRSFRMTLLPHVKDMILDEQVDVRQVWEVVNSFAENDDEKLRLKTTLIRAMATWFASAKHLNDRAMLRNISRCNAWLRARGEKPGPKSIVALSRACVRDLKRGEAGRFERHGWLVRVARDCFGDEQGERLAETLHDWQQRNMASQRTSLL